MAHCDASYMDKGYPITQVTCFLCEGTNHIPAQCQLYPMVQEVSQQVKEGMRQILKRSVEVQVQKDERKRDRSQVVCFNCSEAGHYAWDCTEKEGWW